DFLRSAWRSAGGAQVGPEGFHHLPESIGLGRFDHGLDGDLNSPRGKIKLPGYFERAVGLHHAFHGHCGRIHDISLITKYVEGDRSPPGLLLSLAPTSCGDLSRRRGDSFLSLSPDREDRGEEGH